MKPASTQTPHSKPDPAFIRLLNKLHAAELTHLRELVEQQRHRIEMLEDEVQMYCDQAEHWQRTHLDLCAELAEETGLMIGMTKDGQVGLVGEQNG